MSSALAERQIINLDQLFVEFQRMSPALEGAWTLATSSAEPKSAQALGWLLRYHEPYGVFGQEVKERDGFDYLLALFGRIELGIWTGDLPPQLPDSLNDRVLKTLTHPAVLRYSEEYYPIALQSLLRRRLMGKPVVEAGAFNAPGRFSGFLEMSRPMHRDPDLTAFLWFLDDGQYYGKGLPSVLEVVRNRDLFLQALATRPKDRNDVDAAAVGFSKFLTFCQHFSAFLRSLRSTPMLRAGYWYAHAYWFGRIAEKMRVELNLGIDAFASWGDENGIEARHDDASDQPSDPRAYERQRRRMRKIVNSLTSTYYATPLRAQLDPQLQRNLHPSESRSTSPLNSDRLESDSQ